MFKKIISYLAAAVTIITAFIFGGRIDRQRTSRDNASLDGLRDGITDAEENNRELESGIATAEKLTDDISSNNKTAINRLRTAREILERAKKRADGNKDT